MLKNASIKIKAGERLSVVGLNGAGKTTFIKLLCRLYDTDEGEILLDGVNIRDYDYDEYMKLFSVVFQDFRLLAFSVQENVLLGREDTPEAVDSVLEKVGLLDKVNTLPHGRDTMMFRQFEKDGVQLSGGEQQKLAIARALCKNAPVVILDEPTAALDPVAEYEIYCRFNELVGGKTAVDLPEGKNLVGAFWQPELVLCDYRTLATLPQEYVIDGMAEVIKYGFISDNELLETLRVDTNIKIEEIIARAIYDKKVLVEADERDRGSRQLLNLGHTLGHAIEKCSQFSLSHGQAVAIGMILVTKAAVKRCLCPKDVLTELLYLLTKYGLPTETVFTADEIKIAALNDKKRMGQKLTIVLPQSLGKSVLYPIAVEELEEFIKDGLGYAENN